MGFAFADLLEGFADASQEFKSKPDGHDVGGNADEHKERQIRVDLAGEVTDPAIYASTVSHNAVPKRHRR